MSESSAHRKLVFNLASAVEVRYSNVSITVDVQEIPGDPIPLINGYRPDIYGTVDGALLIAEAKTNTDLDSNHTLAQIISFISYLEQLKTVDLS